MKKLLILIILLSSCDIQKRAIKNKEQRKVNEVVEKTVKRQGDTVKFQVPKITYKDTTIYTVNRQGTTLRTVYNNRGQISQIECFASMIEEITKSNRQLVEAIKNKDREKTEEFDSSVILYGFLGLGILFIIGLLYLNSKIPKV